MFFVEPLRARSRYRDRAIFRTVREGELSKIYPLTVTEEWKRACKTGTRLSVISAYFKKEVGWKIELQMSVSYGEIPSAGRN